MAGPDSSHFLYSSKPSRVWIDFLFGVAQDKIGRSNLEMSGLVITAEVKSATCDVLFFDRVLMLLMPDAFRGTGNEKWIKPIRCDDHYVKGAPLISMLLISSSAPRRNLIPHPALRPPPPIFPFLSPLFPL